MYTLKIKWFRYGVDEEYAKLHPDASPQYKTLDENTLFIPAEQISFGSEVLDLSEMKAWETDGFMDYAIRANAGDHELIGGTRLIQVDKDSKSTWYLASLAWLLGPEGKTIERLTT